MTERLPLRFLCGPAGSGKTTALLGEVQAALQTGAPVYLLVPEQETVVYEARLAHLLDPTLAFSLHIVNFSRLCDLIARREGGLHYHYIEKGAKSALVYQALASLSPHLSFYGSHRRLDRAVPAIRAAISEMKRYGVTPRTLSGAAEILAEEEDCQRIAARASDLSLLYAAYEELLSVAYDDDEDTLAHTAERLAESDFFRGAYVFVDSFFSLTPVENDILYHIFKKAHAVTVSFAALPGDTAPHLTLVTKQLATTREAARRAGRDVTVIPFTENRRTESAELSHLTAHLWDYTAAPLPAKDKDGAVAVVAARDRYAEAEELTYRIAELVRSGVRYGDIAVIARQLSPFAGILDTAFEKAGIPCFFSVPKRVDNRPAARLLFCALAAVYGGFRREDILTLAKTGLCSLTDDEADALEAYTLTWHLRGRRAFETPFSLNPDGYVATRTKRGEKLLALAEAGREKLLGPLLAFADTFAEAGGTRTAAEIGKALYELLCAYGVWDALAAEAEALRRIGEKAAADETEQLWGILMESLDTLARTLPDTRLSASVYKSLLAEVLAVAHVGTIPAGIDAVTVGEASGLRTKDVSHVFLLDANEGLFPGTPPSDGFFSDTDRIRLEGAGVVLAPTSDTLMREELFWFYRAVATPAVSLTILYAEKDGSAPLSPSQGVERILSLLPHVAPVLAEDRPSVRRIFTPADTKTAAYRGDALTKAAVAELGYTREESCVSLTARGDTLSPEAAESLFGRNLSLSQSRLDSYVLCRFGYFCQYAADLKEPPEAKLSQVNVGTFVHRIFATFLARVRDLPLPLPEEEFLALVDELVGDCVREIVPDSRHTGRVFYLFARLKGAVIPSLRSLMAEFAQSDFYPAFFELPVGMDAPFSVPALTVPLSDGRTVSLRGVIDRLDTFRDGENTYVRVVDYKTGEKRFRMEDISEGLHVQLLLYLFSAVSAPDGPARRALLGGGTKLCPAAAYYFSAPPGGATASSLLTSEEAAKKAEDSILRSGVFLNDRHILSAMDQELSTRFVPVSVKDGTVKGTGLVSAEELEQIREILEEAVSQIGQDMVRGDARALPKVSGEHGPCNYCAMKALCRAADGKEAEDA